MINTKEMELALISNRRLPCYYKKNIVVPNVSYGLQFNHELDLCVLTRSGYIVEIEIKISKADLVKDFDKPHQHKDERIKNLYYAFPEYLLESCEKLIPPHCGIIIVQERGKSKRKFLNSYIHRKPKNLVARKLNDKETLKLYALALLRYWSIKMKNL